MDRRLGIIFFLILAFLGTLSLENNLTEFFLNLNIEYSKLISKFIIRFSLILLFYYFIRKINLDFLLKFSPSFKVLIYPVLLIPLFVTFLFFMIKMNSYFTVDIEKLFWFSIGMMAIGFVEEFLFRGIILCEILYRLKNNKNSLFLGALISSSLFALLHLFNLTDPDKSIQGIILQVYYAFSLGIYFTALFYITKSVIINSLLHGFMNITFGAQQLLSDPNKIKKFGDPSWISLWPSFLLFSLISLAGFYFLFKVERKTVNELIKN